MKLLDFVARLGTIRDKLDDSEVLATLQNRSPLFTSDAMDHSSPPPEAHSVASVHRGVQSTGLLKRA